MRDHVMALFQAGLRAADPARAVARALDRVIDDPPGRDGRWQVIALGKAAPAMAQAALAGLPGTRALVVTHAAGQTDRDRDPGPDRAQVLIAGHPEPDAAGLAAACRVEAVLAGLRPQDRLLALISGGGSAMLPAPKAGLGLADLVRVNALLLASGAAIGQVNLIRQSLDRLKGGGWLRLSAAPVTALILSDVPGDDLRAIASGPTVAAMGTPACARRAAQDLGIWDHFPLPVRVVLDHPPPVIAPGAPARNILIGSNRHSLAAMIAAGAQDGGLALDGDVADCAAALWDRLHRAPPGPALVFGGETTVRLTGSGMGGRNQELALRLACLAEARPLAGPWIFAAMGSDGRDGPGHAAGGIVGPDTPARLRSQGIDPAVVLARNDSTPALAAVDGLIVTGPTGTNVADLAVFLRPPSSPSACPPSSPPP